MGSYAIVKCHIQDYLIQPLRLATSAIEAPIHIMFIIDH